MKRTIALAVVLLAVSSTAQAVKPGAESPTERQIVGWTSTPFSGDTGMLTLIQACRGDFPGSLVATSTDVSNTTSVLTLPVGEAWLRPEIAGATGTRVIDKSGESSLSLGLSSLSGGDGLIMTDAGAFGPRRLNTVLPVACAK